MSETQATEGLAALTPEADAIYRAALYVLRNVHGEHGGAWEPERVAFRVVFNWEPAEPAAIKQEAAEDVAARVFARVLDRNDGDCDSADPADWIVAAVERALDCREDECDRLRAEFGAALLHYGQHSAGCSFATDKLCTCGFAAAARAALRVA